MVKPVIDHGLCDGSGTCYDVCPTDPNVFDEPHDGKCWVINLDECIECGACEVSCPTQAIKMVD